MVIQTQALSLEEYIRRYEEEGAFEIIAGEWRKIIPPVMIHGWIIRTLMRVLDEFCRTHKLGEIITESPYVLTYDANWVKGSRVPDLMFFAQDRWQAYLEATANWKNKPFAIMPDLVIEVLSNDDMFSTFNSTLRLYEADGVRLIWVIDPHKKTVDVYEAGQRQALSEADTLNGGAVLPNLEISLTSLFSLPKPD